jgi:hypothetical protein
MSGVVTRTVKDLRGQEFSWVLVDGGLCLVAGFLIQDSLAAFASKPPFAYLLSALRHAPGIFDGKYSPDLVMDTGRLVDGDPQPGS